MAIKKADRARQFMPFAALTGYYEVIKQREKIIEPRKERRNKVRLYVKIS